MVLSLLKAMLSRCFSLCAGLKDPRHLSVLQAVAVSSCRHLSSLPFTMASWKCTQQLSDSVVFLISIAPCTCHARKHLLYNAITIPTNTTPANACLTTQSYPHRKRPSNAIISPQTPTLQFCYTYKHLLYNAIILPQTPTSQRHYIPTNTYLPCNAIIFPQTHTLQWHYISTNICFTILSYQHKRLPYTIYLQTPTLQFHHINTNTYLTTPSDPHKHLLFNSVIIPQNTFFSFFCFTNLKQKEAQSARAEFRTLINSLAC